jgi:hypothetical protein
MDENMSDNGELQLTLLEMSALYYGVNLLCTALKQERDTTLLEGILLKINEALSKMESEIE